MANVRAVNSVGESLLASLRDAYPQELSDEVACTFKLFSSDDMSDPGNYSTMLTLYLYRVTMNEHRVTPGKPGRSNGLPPLALTLHYLLTIWADSALSEHLVIAWAMNHLYKNPVLNASSLSQEGNWRPDEIVQVSPTALPTEDLMRIWDAVDSPYHLSVAYSARVVYVEDQPSPDGNNVVAKLFEYGEWRQDT